MSVSMTSLRNSSSGAHQLTGYSPVYPNTKNITRKFMIKSKYFSQENSIELLLIKMVLQI
jgi:hypothetical protein